MNGQMAPEEFHASVAPGERELLSSYGPTGAAGGSDESYLTLSIDTECEAGDCAAVQVRIDDRVLAVPGHGYVTLLARGSGHELWVFNGGRTSATVRVAVGGSFRFCR